MRHEGGIQPGARNIGDLSSERVRGDSVSSRFNKCHSPVGLEHPRLSAPGSRASWESSPGTEPLFLQSQSVQAHVTNTGQTLLFSCFGQVIHDFCIWKMPMVEAAGAAGLGCVSCSQTLQLCHQSVMQSIFTTI